MREGSCASELAEERLEGDVLLATAIKWRGLKLHRVAARAGGVSTIFVVLEGKDTAGLRRAADGRSCH